MTEQKSPLFDVAVEWLVGAQRNGECPKDNLPCWVEVLLPDLADRGFVRDSPENVIITSNLFTYYSRSSQQEPRRCCNQVKPTPLYSELTAKEHRRGPEWY